MATELTGDISKRHNGYVAYATGAGAIDHTLTPRFGFVLDRVELHLSAAGGAAEAFVIKRDSSLAATVYDTVIDSQDMNAATDHVFSSDVGVPFLNGDVLAFTWTNTGTKTWGLQAYYRAIE